MFWKNFVVFLIVSVFLLLWGCSEVSQPEADSQYLLATQGFSIFDEQVEFMERGGLPLNESKAIFSVGWRELMDTAGTTTEILGHATAIAFEQPLEQRPHPPRGGIDMGSVFINYASNQLELNKWTGREGGVIYMLSHRMWGTSNPALNFVPNTLYEFEVTGSSVFDPVQLGITSPPSLLEITSHSAGQTVSATEDLTVTWTGGKANTGVVLHIHPAPPNRPGGPGSPRGGHHHRGRHPFPPAPLSTSSIVVVLQDNPGSHTFASADIQELLNQTGASEIVLGVSQLDINEVDHNGEILSVVMHDKDGIMLAVQ
jgi:hypothetical protein